MSHYSSDFLGLNQFVWWFGVVENRIDPLNLGRCQVRCFGWHNEDTAQISTVDLPWAHPVVPFGVTNVHPPKEGTMVFGFFADGKEGRFPVLMGTVPGIPTESREPQEGFSDPYTQAQRSGFDQPRKVLSSVATRNAAGPTINNDVPRRFPENLNEPTVSRLARPIKNTANGSNALVALTSSIANTTIQIQRNNRVSNVVSASGYTWNEFFPGYNPTYPFNSVMESESGHAIELDDTRGFERVQVSHRVGSTLEFLESGSVKMKSFKDKQDIVMRNHKSFVQGIKDETVHSDMFLKVAGKLVIHAGSLEIITTGDASIKGDNLNLTAITDVNMFANKDLKISSAKNLQLSAAFALSMAGDAAGVRLTSPTTITVDGGIATRIAGADFVVNTLTCSLDSLITQILPPVVPSVSLAGAPNVARYNKKSAKPLNRTSPSKSREKMDIIKAAKGDNI